MTEVIDEIPNKKLNPFSILALILIGCGLLLGIVLELIEFGGLAFLVPCGGFLVGHLTIRVLTRKSNRTQIVLAIMAFVATYVFVFYQIEVTQYISYNALIVLVVATVGWFATEGIIHLVKKNAS